MLAMCTSDVNLDISKYASFSFIVTSFSSVLSRCVMMCLVHDLAEAQGEPMMVVNGGHFMQSASLVGDIVPREGIPKAEKRRLEEVSIVSLPSCTISNTSR